MRNGAKGSIHRRRSFSVCLSKWAGTRTLGIKTKYTKRVVNWRIIKIFRHIVRSSFNQQLCSRSDRCICLRAMHMASHVVLGSVRGGFALSLASSRMRGFWAVYSCGSCCTCSRWWVWVVVVDDWFWIRAVPENNAEYTQKREKRRRRQKVDYVCARIIFTINVIHYCAALLLLR